MLTADFLVVGAGIAGVSVAYELAAHASVIVLEQESQPGYHTTGRSATLYTELYGNGVIRALTRSSRPLLFEPPATFSPGPFVHARGAMFIASNEQRSTLDAFYRTLGFSDALRVLTAD